MHLNFEDMPCSIADGFILVAKLMMDKMEVTEIDPDRMLELAQRVKKETEKLREEWKTDVLFQDIFLTACLVVIINRYRRQIGEIE